MASQTAQEMHLDLEELHINEGKDLITYDPENIPCTLIVTGVSPEVFENSGKKASRYSIKLSIFYFWLKYHSYQ